MDPRVLDAMLPYLTSSYGNPHSRTHAYGWESEDAMEQARSQVALLIGADPKEIVFTSGATESNNIALKGVSRYSRSYTKLAKLFSASFLDHSIPYVFYRFYKARRNHIITSQTDHKCVLDSCRQLEAEGFEVTYLPVKESGRICLEQLEKAMRKETSIVSIMSVNNEIGVIQPIKEIGEMCRKNKVRQIRAIVRFLVLNIGLLSRPSFILTLPRPWERFRWMSMK